MLHALAAAGKNIKNVADERILFPITIIVLHNNANGADGVKTAVLRKGRACLTLIRAAAHQRPLIRLRCAPPDQRPG